MSDFNTPNESIEDTVASLLDADANHVLSYDDQGDKLTVSLSDSVSATSLETDSVTFNQDITDPEGNTVTSLSDPVRVTEEASTFAGSDVTVTSNNTVVSNESIELGKVVSTIIDDAEDGDIIVKSADWSGWNDDTGNLTAQNNTVLSGSFTLEHQSPGVNSRVSALRGSLTTNTVRFDIQVGSDTGNSNDNCSVRFEEDGVALIGGIKFNDGSGNVEFSGSEVLSSWTAGQTYVFKIEFDFANDEADVFVGGDEKLTNEPLSQSANGLDQVLFDNNVSSSGNTRSVYLDDLVELGADATSGDALVAFDSGVPSDIKSWDLATFQRTLDSETVTIDVEDGSGNVLFSDIGQNFDISTVDKSKSVKLRANLSRSDTSNNPTVDYLARRFTR